VKILVVAQFRKSMNRERQEEDLDNPVEERRFKRRVVGGYRVWASAPVAPLGLKAVMDSLENAALKGRSSTVQGMSVKPEGTGVLSERRVLCL
jgi:hypothetical protein